MLRLGIGAALVVALFVAVLGYGHRKYKEGYAAARQEVLRALQEDRARKERLAIEADEALTPTPDDPAALASLCDTDRHCRDGKAAK